MHQLCRHWLNNSSWEWTKYSPLVIVSCSLQSQRERYIQWINLFPSNMLEVIDFSNSNFNELLNSIPQHNELNEFRINYYKRLGRQKYFQWPMFAVLTGKWIRNLGETTTTTVTCWVLPFTFSSIKQHHQILQSRVWALDFPSILTHLLLKEGRFLTLSTTTI